MDPFKKFSRMRKIMKKIVILLAVFGFMFQATSCKSKKAQDDTQVVENADVEKIEAEDAAMLSNADPATSVGPVDDSLQAALGETSTQAATDPTLTTTDAAATETASAASPEIAAAPALDETTLNNSPSPEVATAPTDTATSTALADSKPAEITETPVAESASAPAIETAAPAATETAAITETPAVTASETTVVKTAKAPGSGSLKKITETIPYQHGEGWVNTVYIARPKEKLKEISQKIYGMDKTKELKKINSFLAARSPNAGDKIYYVSPNRPADSTKTLSFYEDTGMMAETYIAQKGDNLKKISKNLLGYENAYKEIWSTNPVISKAGLEEGETLRYWKSSSAVAPTMAANTEMPKAGAQVIESTSQLPSQPIAKNEMKTATPPAQPQAELPPPPPAPDMNAQTPPPPQPQAELPPPPPAPDMNAQTPPPPPEEVAAATVAPPVAPKKKVVTPNMEEEQASDGMSSDTTMMLGGAVVLCALLAFALIRRNKKKKEVEMAAMSETSVGT
jgi:hypothetical protein